MNNLIVVYIPTSSRNKATELAQYLLKKKLVACVNIIDAQSLYWWQQEIQSEQESILFAKTIPELYSELVKEVVQVHEYDTPCIAKFTVEVNNAYFDYVKNEVTQKQDQ